jgi:16S rRNA C1402 N4-methylase RsmH
VPSEAEVERNPRARSAKLRAAARLQGSERRPSSAESA